jgi:hypothetical protein
MRHDNHLQLKCDSTLETIPVGREGLPCGHFG